MIIGIVTLGCDKNTVDSEHLAGILRGRGHEVLTEGARDRIDAIIVITCGFILDARTQSLETIAQFAEMKRERGNPRRLIVAGCLSQRSAEDLRERFPEIDLCAGVGKFEELVAMVEGLDAAVKPAAAPLPPPDMRISRPMPRARLDPWPHAFLKIADGCDHACSFCAIPSMKGPYASVPREILLEEARGLVQVGARELVLVAQDIAPYGRDLYDDYALPELLRDLCRIDGDFRLRLLYMYPSGLTDRFVEVFASEEKIQKYLDVPLQHLDPAILRAMRRPAGDEAVRERIAALRKAVPEVALRTTMIVGFPGESKPAFERLLDGVRELRFDWLGVFAWSPEEGTPALELPGRVSPATAERRREKVLKVQQGITHEAQRAQVGRVLRVLIESFAEDGSEAHGRSYREAPEVDGLVVIPLGADPEYVPENGEFVEVEIVEAEPYDLIGRMITPR
jgi:ribosomal protein S12 methylthiotransferase